MTDVIVIETAIVIEIVIVVIEIVIVIREGVMVIETVVIVIAIVIVIVTANVMIISLHETKKELMVLEVRILVPLHILNAILSCIFHSPLAENLLLFPLNHQCVGTDMVVTRTANTAHARKSATKQESFP